MIQDVGTDIVSIKRLQKVISNNPSFLSKNYTSNELFIASTLREPLYFYATRFAAKEAIFKATGAKFEFCEIEILRGKSGEPIPSILNHSDIKIKLSLSYDGDYALAFCIVLS